MFDHEDVAWVQLLFLMAKLDFEFVGQVVACDNFCTKCNRNQPDCGSGAHYEFAVTDGCPSTDALFSASTCPNPSFRANICDRFSPGARTSSRKSSGVSISSATRGSDNTTQGLFVALAAA